MGERRDPTLDAADARPLPARSVASDDVGAAAEVVAVGSEEDRPHRFVATGGVDRVDEALHHRVVDGVALRGAVEGEVEHAVGQRDLEAVDRCVAHRSNRSLMASSAPWRSLAPPGTSGSRTGPCSRLGRRTVA